MGPDFPVPEVEKMGLLLKALKNTYEQSKSELAFTEFAQKLLQTGKNGYQEGSELDNALKSQNYTHAYGIYILKRTRTSGPLAGTYILSSDQRFDDEFIKRASNLTPAQLEQAQSVVNEYQFVCKQIISDMPANLRDADDLPGIDPATARKRHEARREASTIAGKQLEAIYNQHDTPLDKKKKSAANFQLDDAALERIADAQQQFERAQKNRETISATPPQTTKGRSV